MNYKEARRKSIYKRLVGVSIIAPAIISTAISFLKLLYFRLDDGTQLGNMIAQPFKQLISHTYQNTQFLNFFWENSPTPNHMNFSEIHNAYFLAIYLLIFVGLAFYASGTKIASRLSITNEEIESATEIPSNSIFTQIHQLYLAPVITAIFGAILLKILDL